MLRSTIPLLCTLLRPVKIFHSILYRLLLNKILHDPFSITLPFLMTRSIFLILTKLKNLIFPQCLELLEFNKIMNIVIGQILHLIFRLSKEAMSHNFNTLQLAFLKLCHFQDKMLNTGQIRQSKIWIKLINLFKFENLCLRIAAVFFEKNYVILEIM